MDLASMILLQQQMPQTVDGGHVEGIRGRLVWSVCNLTENA